MEDIPLLLNQKRKTRDFTSKKRNIDFKLNAKRIFGSELTFNDSRFEVIIVTSQDDAEVNYLGPTLIQSNINYYRINAEDFLNHYEFTIKIKNNEVICEMNYNDEKINLNSIDVIWPRHFINEDMFFHMELDELVKKHMIVEWQEMFSSIFSLCKKKVMVPITYSINKPIQLQAATKVDLKIPNTIITNSMKDLEDFFHEYKGKIFAKALSHHSLYSSDGISHDFYGRTFNDLDEILNENVSLSPVIYQELIDKRESEEYRITVFGKNIFSHKYINVNEDDWHFEDISNVKLVSEELPPPIKDKILNLFLELNLTIGTIDMIKLRDDWFFLEVNTSGDWRWLEQIVGEDFSMYAADMLKGKT